MVTKRAYSFQKEPKLFQLLGKSAQLLKKSQRSRLIQNVLIMKTVLGQTNQIFCTILLSESLAYSHSLVSHWTSRWCPNSGMKYATLNNQALFLCLSTALHSIPTGLYAIDTEPAIVKVSIMWWVEDEGAGTLSMMWMKWLGRTYTGGHPGFRDPISRSKCIPVPSVVWYHMVAKVDSGLVINRNHSGWLALSGWQ